MMPRGFFITAVTMFDLSNSEKDGADLFVFATIYRYIVAGIVFLLTGLWLAGGGKLR